LTERTYLDGGEAILPGELEAAERAAGVVVGSGDALFVRTGFPQALSAGADPNRVGVAGIHAACLPWLYERQVCVLASDAWTDVEPSGYELDFPVHRIAEVAMGVRCIDNGDFEALAATCRSERRWEFLVCIAPLRLEAATGCPINPVAVF
jgi:kynurenine formamidase